jgi:hypothetical protein
VAWLADQIYGQGTYGYIGNSQLRRPRQVAPEVEIENTDDDEVYRTGRTQLTHYLAALPNSTYSVVLHFAHLMEGKLWHPAIDVRMEGRTVVRGLDARQIGRLSAARRRCDAVRVTDGVLDIELTPSDVALSGVEIVRG